MRNKRCLTGRQMASPILPLEFHVFLIKWIQVSVQSQMLILYVIMGQGFPCVKGRCCTSSQGGFQNFFQPFQPIWSFVAMTRVRIMCASEVRCHLLFLLMDLEILYWQCSWYLSSTSRSPLQISHLRNYRSPHYTTNYCTLTKLDASHSISLEQDKALG